MTRNVQGYEIHCIDILVETYDETDIVAGNRDEIPTIKYPFDGKDHYWFPDVFIKSNNTLIEVKCFYTYNISPAKMKAKMDHCLFDCELWVIDNCRVTEKVFRNAKTGEYTYLYGDVFVIGESIVSEIYDSLIFRGQTAKRPGKVIKDQKI